MAIWIAADNEIRLKMVQDCHASANISYTHLQSLGCSFNFKQERVEKKTCMKTDFYMMIQANLVWFLLHAASRKLQLVLADMHYHIVLKQLRLFF